MLVYHWYTWEEGVTQAAVVQGINMGLRRLTVDVLLPGPTTLEQLECSIVGPRKIKISYSPPATYLNARRTAVKSAHLAGMGLGARTPVQQEQVLNMLAATARVTGHERTLVDVRQKQGKIEMEIADLPFDIDQYWCRRDDWGQGPTMTNPSLGADGVQIAFYRHEHSAMQAANQFVWILHLECTSTWRPPQMASPNRPTGFGDFSNYA